ncbi:hypothetical protein [Pyxidicoccus sp. MSG2]|uniref:hypothetical protein n=1 Tax=Pyxidicoccus sp. MSG2 TaxID=2996790 RepID=UPI00227214F9|nr:hypothetical protein [Pyxidicoccus sp. MSG2]MCY1018100.1 hypothetical protein [Pyxidicoccus sp. MSG2]
MKLRELKEAAHALFARGRYVQCTETYARILRLAPKDPNVRVRHAESCRRAGDRQSAIASYRAASELLMEQGCESRARGALRAALELDPKDPMIIADLARLGQQASPVSAPEDERVHPLGATGFFERQGTASAKGAATPRASHPGHVSPPPPPPPSYILRAAEETPAPAALPAVPAVAPLHADAPGATGRALAPIPRMNPVRASGVVPSITPVIQGRLITQAPVPAGDGASGRPAAVPPAPRPSRPSLATMAPLPALARSAGAPLPRPAATPGQNVVPGSASLTMLPIPPRAGATPGAGGDARAAAPAAMPYRPELRRLGPNAVALRVSPQARWVIIRSDSPLEVSRAESLPAPGAQQAGAAYAPEPHSVSPASANH